MCRIAGLHLRHPELVPRLGALLTGVLCETDEWVAMASEYRALSGLPGVEKAAIWEPEPEVVYAWTR